MFFSVSIYTFSSRAKRAIIIIIIIVIIRTSELFFQRTRGGGGGGRWRGGDACTRVIIRGQTAIGSGTIQVTPLRSGTACAGARSAACRSRFPIGALTGGGGGGSGDP